MPDKCLIHEILLDTHLSGSETRDMPGNGHIFFISNPRSPCAVQRFSKEKQLYMGKDHEKGGHFENVPDCLLKDERKIYDQLLPIYQNIYLQAFDNEQRQRVVLYVHRGLDPYDAINIILNVEHRKYQGVQPKRRGLTPAERSATLRSPKKEILGLNRS